MLTVHHWWLYTSTIVRHSITFQSVIRMRLNFKKLHHSIEFRCELVFLGSTVCPDEYHVLHRRFCYRIKSTPETWSGAIDGCAEEGAEIASVHSASEMRFIRALMWGARVQKIYLGNESFFGLLASKLMVGCKMFEL